MKRPWRGAEGIGDPTALAHQWQLTPKVTVYLHSRRARAAAFCGDDTTWDRYLGMSFDLLVRSRPDKEPAWLYWLDEAFLHGNAGAGALELGRAHDAERHNRLAVATINPALPMDRMEYLAQLARARAAIGEVEHANNSPVSGPTSHRTHPPQQCRSSTPSSTTCSASDPSSGTRRSVPASSGSPDNSQNSHRSH